MNILILGAAGFIGTNLVKSLAKDKDNNLTLIDSDEKYFKTIKDMNLKNSNIDIKVTSFGSNMDFSILENQDIVYHLVSSNIPSTSNQHITNDIENNVLFSAKLLESCVRFDVKRVVFISSGGTVYGKNVKCPIQENAPTDPISSYGLQKLAIEKLLYLYNYMYNLDYRVVRLANPYGPYQRPNGVLGAVTTFTYKAINNEKITVYGDGSVVRDFIYIDDAIRGILSIANGETEKKIFNLGSGTGTSINEVLRSIERALNKKMNIEYLPVRSVDVPTNYLDISRFEDKFGKLNPISLQEGILKTAEFLEHSEY